MVSLLGAEWMQYKATGMQPRRKANRDENFCPHGVYPSIGDNEWVAIAVEGDDEWAAFARLVGTDPHDDRYATHAARKANEDSLDTLVRSWTMGRDRWTIADDCQAVGIAAAAVTTLPDMMDRDPQLRHRYQSVQQPGHLYVDIPVSREAIRFAGAEQTRRAGTDHRRAHGVRRARSARSVGRGVRRAAPRRRAQLVSARNFVAVAPPRISRPGSAPV